MRKKSIYANLLNPANVKSYQAVTGMTHKLQIVYGDIFQSWLLGDGSGDHPTNPIRAKLARDFIVDAMGDDCVQLSPTGDLSKEEIVAAVKTVHSETFVDRVIQGNCGEWSGVRPEMADVALAMFAGTMRGVKAILNEEARLVFNPMGAKHHAQRDRSSGFCVFNDMAWAALEFQKAGLKPLYLDWDIHAGDGVYRMLKGSGIPTISIHNGGYFPWDSEMQTGSSQRATKHNANLHSYNFNVVNGDGDEAFKWAMDGAAEIIRGYKPDVILLAAGADGHLGANNLGVDSNYTKSGYEYAARVVADLANVFSNGRVLIGGAGGYQPLKETPEIWALVAEAIYSGTK